MHYAFSHIAVSVFNGGMTTLVALLALIGATSYIFKSFFICFMLIICFGLYFGMIFLPVPLLSIIALFPTPSIIALYYLYYACPFTLMPYSSPLSHPYSYPHSHPHSHSQVVLSLIGPDAQPLVITEADTEALELMMKDMAHDRFRLRRWWIATTTSDAAISPAVSATVGHEGVEVTGGAVVKVIIRHFTKVHHCTGGITLGNSSPQPRRISLLYLQNLFLPPNQTSNRPTEVRNTKLVVW